MKQIRIQQTCPVSSDRRRTQFRQPVASVRRRHRLQPGRRGSTFLIVIALTGLLALVGFMFVTFSGQEQTAAENFASGSKHETDPRLSPDVLFDFALRQVIMGANTEYDQNANGVPDPGEDLDGNAKLDIEVNSALWRGRSSLLANMVGRDIHPFTGQGVNVIWYDEDANNNSFLDPNEDDGAATPPLDNMDSILQRMLAVDQNFDGFPDSLGLLNINDSMVSGASPTSNLPIPDVDYTYPDINAPFLAWRGFALDQANNPVFVVIPSFHRPQYLRYSQLSTFVEQPVPILNWETNSTGSVQTTSRRLLRPHRLHQDLGSDGQPRGPAGRRHRFVWTMSEATSLGLSGPFPFDGAEDRSEDLNGNGVLDFGEDANGNGVLDPAQDLNGNGLIDLGTAKHGVWTLGPWVPNTVYREGQWVVANVSGALWYFKCIVTGVSNAPLSPPTWSGVPPFGTVVDNTITWQRLPLQPPYLEYSFDADADGDGIKEAVWLDLDFPVQQRGDGKYYVPLFAMTIYDADGLVNLNASGNLAWLDVDVIPPPQPFGSEDRNNNGVLDGGLDPRREDFNGNGVIDPVFISRSSQGLSSPWQVNPQWVLNARPTEDLNGNGVLDGNEDRNSNGIIDEFDSPPGRTLDDLYYQYYLLFGHFPKNETEASNMDWWILNMGRAEYQIGGAGSIIDYFAGRWGELDKLLTGVPTLPLDPAAFPRPGLLGGDDNLNLNHGELASPFQAFGHPLDFSGAGQHVVKDPTNVLKNGRWTPFFFRPAGAPQPPDRWVQYINFSSNETVRWGETSTQGGNLMLRRFGVPMFPGDDSNDLKDEPAEMSVDRRFDQGSEDAFPPSENAGLQLSNSDFERTGETSRLMTLADWNLRSNVRAPQIRQQLTADSWDPTTFGMTWFDPALAPAPTPRQRAWEFSSLGINDQFGDPAYEFPPRFANATAANDPFRPELRQLLSVFARDNVAAALHTAPLIDQKYQHPLSLNGVLVFAEDGNRNGTVQPNESDGTANWPIDNGDANHNLVTFAPLTPHPALNASLVTLPSWSAASPPAYPPTNDTQYESWARLDRQRMARDIFVMLYTFCGGDDQRNYTTINDHSNTMTPANANDALYDRQQLREMAQFAVNLVDGLDRDSVITKFEYDKNFGLSNAGPDGITGTPDDGPIVGWNLDDNPFTDDGLTPLLPSDVNYDRGFPEDSIERGVVFGVEAQSLTFSEVVAFQQTRLMGADRNFTLFNEDTQDYAYLFVELRNNAPVTVNLAWPSTDDKTKALWRIRRDDDNDDILNGDVNDNAVTLLEDVARRETPATPREVPSGEVFTIGTGDPVEGSYATACDLRVDHDLNGDFELIIPGDLTDTYNPTMMMALPEPRTDLDLVHNSDFPTATVKKFELESNMATRGSFLNFASKPTGMVKLVLERRLNPYLPNLNVGADPYVGLNPWIPVDRIENVDIQTFGLTDMDDNPTEITARLSNLKSKERPQPFDRAGQADYAGGGPEIFNSIEETNSLTTANLPYGFNRWQPHFDRDFASTVELFSVPTYGPQDLTKELNRSGSKSAGELKFLHPENGNRWYRLLSFVEVPNQSLALINEDVNRNGVLDPGEDDYEDANNNRSLDAGEDANGDGWLSLGNGNGQLDSFPENRKYRVPGRINWNTIRHPEVLAALLDRNDAFSLDLVSGNKHLPDNDESGRDWWSQFIVSRDSLDPITGMFLPGVASARPFRSLSFPAYGPRTVQQTMLRSLPLDNGMPIATRRRLFELGLAHEDGNQNGVLDALEDTNLNGFLDDPDHHTRHQVLSKVLGNSTTRSNVFFAFIQVDFFEAAIDQITGHVRIGAKLDDVQPRRGFFVIDRSRAMEQLNGSHFLPPSTFSFRTNREDKNGNGILDPLATDDTNMNGKIDLPFVFVSEDSNQNGILDPGEDTNGNGVLDDYNSLILYRKTIE